MRLLFLLTIFVLVFPKLAFAAYKIQETNTTSSPSPSSVVVNCIAGPGTPGGCSKATVTTVEKTDDWTDYGISNPINALTGNKFESATDIEAIGGRYALRLNRYYNSRSNQQGLFGIGWRSDFEMQLQDTGDKIDVLQADGRKISFTKTADKLDNSSLFITRYKADKPELGYFERNQSTDISKPAWIWHLPSGKTFQFIAHKQTSLTNSDGRYRFGQLSRVTENTNQSSSGYWSLTYDVKGNLAQVQNHLGDTLKFSYQTTKYNLPKIIISKSERNNSGSQAWQYFLDKKGNLAQVVNPVGERTGYSYTDPNDSHNLTAKYGYDKQGKRQLITKWTYDDYDRAISSTHKDNIEKVTVVYDPDTLIPMPTGHTFTNIITNSIGETTEYTYRFRDDREQLVSIKGVGCSTCGEPNVSYEYDSVGRVTKRNKLDDKGQIISSTRRVFDEMGLILKVIQSNAQGEQTWQSYKYGNPNYPMQPTVISRPSVVKGREAQVKLRYDEQGDLISMTEIGYRPIINNVDEQSNIAATPMQRTTTFHYSKINGNDVVTAIDTPISTQGNKSVTARTEYIWDELGEYITQINYPEGLTEKFKNTIVAGKSVPKEFTSTDGVITTFEYNNDALPIKIHRGDQHLTIGYDDKQRPIKWQNQLGQSISAEYDDSKQQTTYHTYDGQQIVSDYNTEGQLTKRLWLDDKGDVLIGSKNEEYYKNSLTTDNKDYLIDAYQMITPLDIPVIKYPRESKQWLTNISQSQTKAANINITTFEYNPVEELIDLTDKADPSQVLSSIDSINKPQALQERAIYTRVYDDFSRLIYNHDTNSDPTVIEYNLDDSPSSIVSESRYQRAEYDLLGRVVKSISCRTDGILEGMKSGCEEVNYYYKGAYLTKIVDSSQTTQFHYDTDSRLIGESVQFKDNQKEWKTNYKYDELNRIVQVGLPENGSLLYHYDKGREPIEVLYQPAATSWNEKLIRFFDSDHQAAPLFAELAADSARGLLSFKYSNGQQVEATYDLDGNLSKWQDGEYVTVFDSQDSLREVIQSTNKTIVKDNDLSQALAFGSRGELKQVNITGKEPIEYDYNYALQRVSKQQGDRKKLYVWKRNNLLDLEISTNSDVERAGRRYIYIGSTPVALIDYSEESDPKIYSIHSDVFGSPHQITDIEGHVVWTSAGRAVDPTLGDIKVKVQTAHRNKSNSISFSLINSAQANDFYKSSLNYNLLANGRYLDPETGFHYNGRTYFDPKTSSNIAKSPISFAATPMRYAGNTSLINNISNTGSTTWPNRPSIGTTTTPTIDWVKVGANIGKFTRVCARVGGKAVLGVGTILIPTSTSRCAGLGPYGRPYPECVVIYNESHADNLDEYDFPGEQVASPGDCTGGQLDSLYKDMKNSCNKIRKCNRQLDKSCSVINEKIKNGYDCVNKRNRINSICFKGGDRAHIREVTIAAATLNTCIGIAVAKGCL